jgi:hypothetical protein
MHNIKFMSRKIRTSVVGWEAVCVDTDVHAFLGRDVLSGFAGQSRKIWEVASVHEVKKMN